MRRSILIFWGDNKRDIKAHWWHLNKKYVHVSIVLFDEKRGAIHLSPGADDDLHIYRKINDFNELFEALSVLKGLGATELIATQSYQDCQRVATVGWYSCHSLCKDLAQLPIGFCINPLHLARKILRRDGEGFIILRRKKLWVEKTVS